MVLNPTDNRILGNPIMPGGNPWVSPPPMPGMITQRTILSPGLPTNLGGIAGGIVSGFTQFVNGMPVQERCQGNGSSGCSCGGNCNGSTSNIPMPQSMQTLKAPPGRPTLEQIVSRYGKLSLAGSTVIKTPTGDPPRSLNFGPCFEILHFLGTSGGTGATGPSDEPSPGSEEMWIEMIIPCESSGGGTGWIDSGGGDTGGGEGGAGSQPSSVFTLIEQGMVNAAVDYAKGILKNIKSLLLKWQKLCGNQNNNSNFDKLLDCLQNLGNGQYNDSFTKADLQPGPGNPCLVPCTENAEGYTDTSRLPHRTYIDIDYIRKEALKDAQDNPKGPSFQTLFQLYLNDVVLHEMVHYCSSGAGIQPPIPPLTELDVQVLTNEMGGNLDNGYTDEVAGVTKGIVKGNYFDLDTRTTPYTPRCHQQ